MRQVLFMDENSTKSHLFTYIEVCIQACNLQGIHLLVLIFTVVFTVYICTLIMQHMPSMIFDRGISNASINTN